MSDDDKKATEGTGEKATNGAAKATSAADETNSLKHIGGSRSGAWNNHIGAQAFRALYPYRPGKDQDGKQRDIVVAGLTGIAPRDEMEGMIAAQMLACHDAAMSCFRHAVAALCGGRD